MACRNGGNVMGSSQHDRAHLNSAESRPGAGGTGMTRRGLLATTAVGLLASAIGGAIGAPTLAYGAAPQGQLTWGVHISLAPTWFDPAETPGIITPFMVMYALHDAVVKPMPGQALAPSLAESWSVSDNGQIYE